MSDWVKTEEGWEQTGGNVDTSEINEIKDSLTKKQDIIPSYTKDEYLAIRDSLPDGTLVNINDDFDKPYKHCRIYNANTIVVDVEFADRDDATIQLTNANQGEFLIINPRKAGGLAYRHIYSLNSRNFNVTFANGTLRITYSNGTMWGETIVEGYGITVSNI